MLKSSVFAIVTIIVIDNITNQLDRENIRYYYLKRTM